MNSEAYYNPESLERAKQALIDDCEMSRIALLPEWPVRCFKVNEVPFELMRVPKPERCCRISKKCEYRAVVKVYCLQFCAPCYLGLVRATMGSYGWHLRDLYEEGLDYGD